MADRTDGPVCMWEDPGAQGDEYVHWRPFGTGLKKNIDGWDGDNETSSIRNHSWYAIRVYDNDDYTGTSICVPSGTTVNKLGDDTWNFDNEAESLKTVTSC